MGLFFWQVPTPEELEQQRAERDARLDAADEQEKFVESRCVPGWPARHLRVMKVSACAFGLDEIALVLGFERDDVYRIVDEISSTIFGSRPYEKDEAEWFMVVWFQSHKVCCVPKAHEELATDRYPLADLRGIQQPCDRRRQEDEALEQDDDFSDPEIQTRIRLLFKRYCNPPSQRPSARPHRNQRDNRSA